MLLLLLLAWVAFADVSVQEVSQPSIQFSSVGGSLGLFGHYDALSFYTYVNESSFLTAAADSSRKHLYLRQTGSPEINVKVADLDGDVWQMHVLSNDSVLLNGNFTSINNQTVQAPAIYSLSNNNASSLVSVAGTVKTFYVDNRKVYLGGDFVFNDTVGAAVYDLDTRVLSSMPFKGFGAGAVVNAIVKIEENADDKSDEGSIVFGGSFSTLGMPELLVHNSSAANVTRNSTNTSSLIFAEQIISLKNGVFTNVNGAGSTPDSDVICPQDDVEWALKDGEGGQWLVELPDEMKGLSPTKARVYVPSGGDDGVKTFRIYSYPNNGIMNLSYVDPATNTLKYCDAWCPLLTRSELENATDTNARAVANKSETADELSSNVTYIDDNGSFSMYYDASTKTKTLGYAAGYQEFSFENTVKIDKIGLTVIDWYGSKGVLGGFELFSNAITVYGNQTLNEPNCGGTDDTFNNYASIDDGSFVSVRSLKSQVTSNDYMVSTDTNARITLYPNITYSGYYSLIITTPGCIADDSCSQRPIINASVISSANELLSTNIIYQNNDYEKFDYLYYGHFNGTIDSDVDTQNRIEISYNGPISSDQSTFMVVDKVVANIVSLDNYYNTNSTNSTASRRSQNVTHVPLNGLFEYSLSNFSSFDQALVYTSINGKTVVSENNTYVDNSTINVLGQSLGKNASVTSLVSNGKRLIVGGEFSSTPDVFAMQLGDYNTTSNQATEKDVIQRDVSLNNTFSVAAVSGGSLLLGAFEMSPNSSVTFKDLSNNNSTVSVINNFALYSDDGQWYGFGNSFEDVAYNKVTNITIGGSDYYIFSSEDNTFKVWSQSNNSFVVTDASRQWRINSASQLDSSQQILAGDSFNIMDLYSTNQAAINSAGNFSVYNFSVSTGNFSIDRSYYVNKSLSVIAGDFQTQNVSKVGLVGSSGQLSPLQGDIKWANDSTIQSLYVDSEAKYLFIGFNGSVTIDNDALHGGVMIYNLANNSVSSFQPPQLSNNNAPVSVNTIVLYDKSSQLLVGGDFDKAGSLGCSTLCIYDMANTRWIDPSSVGEQSTAFGGVATDIRFYQNNEVVISGNLTLSNSNVNFITYNFDNGNMGANDALNKLGDKYISKFIVNDQTNADLSARLVAIGPGFVSGYDGSSWNSIDSEIAFDNQTQLDDIKLLSLSKSNSASPGTYFDKNNVLLLAGRFTLHNYGMANLAFYNGTNWIPYVFSSAGANQIGEIKSILMKDSYRFTSSDDISNAHKHMSKGKVVGVSLACALGSTTLLGLLYIIPYFALFRKSYTEEEMNNQRIQEREMMSAVNPEDLLHEMEMQKNT